MKCGNPLRSCLHLQSSLISRRHFFYQVVQSFQTLVFMSIGQKFNSANLVPNFSHLNVSRMIPKQIKSVLISEPTDPICEKILKQHNISVTTKVGLSKEDLKEEVKVGKFWYLYDCVIKYLACELQ